MRNSKLSRVLVGVTGLVCAAVIAGCPRQGEGPAERVGKSMDKGAAAVGRGVEKTGEAIGDAAKGR